MARYRYFLLSALRTDRTRRVILEAEEEAYEHPPIAIMDAATTRLKTGECVAEQMLVLAVPLGAAKKGTRMYRVKEVEEITGVLTERMV